MKKIKLLLINPPKLNAVMAEYDHVAYENSGAKPPMQLLFLASYIEHVLPEAEVGILDTQVSNLSHEESVRAVAEFDPDVVGITSWTEFWYDTALLINNIKLKLPKVHVCVGGPNAGIYPEVLLENKNIDSVVCGYGEKPLEVLLKVLMGESADQVDGLYFKRDLNKVSEYKWNNYVDKDNTRFLPREKIPIRSYSAILSGGPAASIITSKGCPFKCTYCKILSEKFCFYSPDFVLEEFKAIQNLGISEVEVYDDTFSVSKDRVREICNRMISEGINIKWDIRDRVTNSDLELLMLMKRAGLRRVSYGVEAASDETLKRIKKGIRIEDVHKAVKTAKKAGLTVLSYFMIGLPGDKKEDFQRILDLSLELDIDYANYSLVIAYPKTELYRSALEQGMFKKDVWLEYIRNPTKDMKMPLYLENFDRQELVEFVNKCYKRFYFRPKSIFRELKRINSMSQLVRKVKIAANMIHQ